MKHRHVGLLLAMSVFVLAAGQAVAASSIVLPRPGQVGIGIQGQYGTLLKTGEFGELFDSGGGIAVRLRYRLRYERAIGLSFEGQSFDTRVPGAAGDTTVRSLKLIMSGFDFYQLFGTQEKATRMLSIGAGLVQPSAKLNSDETTFPSDGVYLSAGAGVERFFYRSWAYDISARYFAIFQEGNTNHDFQASAGLIFYASY
jgi:hypothetical protein